jgi:hypothetical protein
VGSAAMPVATVGAGPRRVSLFASCFVG